MSEQYKQRLITHLTDRRYQPRTIRQLAIDLGVDLADLHTFRDTVAELTDSGKVVLGPEDAVALPPPGKEMTGVFRANPRGFGFIVPDEPTEHGDLFVPPGQTLGALTGDRVKARVFHERGRARDGRSPYTGRVTEILQRAERHYVGALHQRAGQFFVKVDGQIIHEPILIRDPYAKNARVGDKVVIEIIHYPAGDDPGEGVIVERLGEAGEPDVETAAVIRAYGLAETFPQEVSADARAAIQGFDDNGAIPADREDLTGGFICTIDPPDAKDYDDAISIEKFDKPQPDGAVWELGVHIADVSHFVKAEGPLDVEAKERGNSTYLPRRVIPMLPELLSNGVCSLQEGVNRFAKSCFIRYSAAAKVVGQRFSRSVIRSAKRLTYLEAQALIDGDLREAIKHARSEPKYPRELMQKLKLMNELAKTIRQRRLGDGMIVLGLPEVELVFDDSGRVMDAVPEDNAFTHTLIEMFMVEANEAAARLFDNAETPMIRRIHPNPESHDLTQLRAFARVAGYNIPLNPSRRELQTLLDSVRDKPAQHAVHLAVLKTLSKAEYSPMLIGHFALASEHYTHFTSPIRRYPDLIVHRGLDRYLDLTDNGTQKKPTKQLGKAMREVLPDEPALRDIGRHCTDTEQNSTSAERELRYYLVLELLQEHLGEDFDGTVTGVTGRGVYVQINKYLVDGFVPLADLPGAASERWKFNPNTGALVAQRSGKTLTIGDQFTVRIASIDLVRRTMELVILDPSKSKSGKRSKKPLNEGKRRAARENSQLKQAGKRKKQPQTAGKKKTAKRGRGKKR